MNFKRLWNYIVSPKTKDTNSFPPPPLGQKKVLITETAAMKVSAVYSAVKLISEGVALLPMEIQRFNKARRCYEPCADHPLLNFLCVAPSKRMTAFDFWRETCRHILLRGNAYIIPRYNAFADIEELVLCSPGSVAHDPLRDIYVVGDVINAVYGNFTSRDIIHLRNIGIDGGFSGMSTVSLAAEALGISILSDNHISKNLSNGGLIRGIVSGDVGGGLPTFGAPNSKQTSDVGERVEKDLADGKQILSLPSDIKFQPLALSPADARVLENKQMTIRDIARFFRVHPELIYEGTNNTYKSSEVPNVMFLHQTLAPLLRQIELELLVKLLPRDLWSDFRFHFDREAMYMTDLSTEVTYIKGTLEAGVYSVNDWRAKKGLPAISGGESVLVSANLKTLDSLIAEGDSTFRSNI